MNNRKWNQFNKLTEKCYSNMIGADKDGSCWLKAFELMKEIIYEERQTDPNYVRRLDMIDDVTDYEYDILGWLDDCMDELDMRGEYEAVLGICNDLLGMFDWNEYSDSDIKFTKTIVLRELGRNKEAEKYCRKWIQSEPENIVAATAAIYAYIDEGEYDETRKLIEKFIIDPTICTDDNDILFTAASKFYEAIGDNKKKRQIDNAIKEYEDRIVAYYEDGAFDEEDMDWFDGELPFN